MKKALIIMSLFSLVVLSGCSFSNKNQDSVTTGTGNVQNISSGINLLFSGSNEEIVNVFHKSGEPTILSFTNVDANIIKIKVSYPKNKQGNLRLAQIIMPNGTTDGPFGVEGEYKLNQTGWYQLIFNENIMAGDPWNGDAKISITISK